MAEVDVFLKEEWPALGDLEILKKQLKQCRVRFVCDIFYMKAFMWKYFFGYISGSQPGVIPRQPWGGGILVMSRDNLFVTTWSGPDATGIQ